MIDGYITNVGVDNGVVVVVVKVPLLALSPIDEKNSKEDKAKLEAANAEAEKLNLDALGLHPGVVSLNQTTYTSQV